MTLNAADGCWFLLARGSGIFVHTGGRTRALRSISDALLSGFGHGEARHPIDLCFAKVARRQGLHSLQLLAGNDQPYGERLERRFGVPSVPAAELIVAGTPCMTRATPLMSGCVPGVELRTGLAAQHPCTCSDEQPRVLNCAGKRNSSHHHFLISAASSTSTGARTEGSRFARGRLQEPRCVFGHLRAAEHRAALLGDRGAGGHPQRLSRLSTAPSTGEGLRRSFQAALNRTGSLSLGWRARVANARLTSELAAKARTVEAVLDQFESTLARRRDQVELERGRVQSSKSTHPCIMLPGLGERCPVEFGNRQHEQLNAIILAVVSDATPVSSDADTTTRATSHHSQGAAEDSRDACHGLLSANASWLVSRTSARPVDGRTKGQPKTSPQRPPMAFQQWVQLGGLDGGHARHRRFAQAGLECALLHSTARTTLRLPTRSYGCGASRHTP